jgi:hypothetical protein
VDTFATRPLGRNCGWGTAVLVQKILAGRPHPEMRYSSRLGILRLSKQRGPARVEVTPRRAVALGACTYQSLKRILERQLEGLRLDTPAAPPAADDYHSLRGPGYFQMQ